MTIELPGIFSVDLHRYRMTLAIKRYLDLGFVKDALVVFKSTSTSVPNIIDTDMYD